MAKSLAVAYRPRCFADVSGQRHIRAILLDAARRHDPQQQILLSGGSGLGKTTLARLLAAALFCTDQQDDGDACGRCGECTAIADGSHPDLIEFDAASHGGKEEIRAIADRAHLAPLRARWKIFVIDEAHGLSTHGTQAALKMLEEPPGHVLFVLATTEPEKLGVALRGRCSWMEVLPPTRTDLEANLSRIAFGENWELDDDTIDSILAVSDPELGLRGAVMTLEKLAGMLGEHRDANPDRIADILGSLSAAQLDSLTDAIATGDRAHAQMLAAKALDRCGSRQVHSRLRERFRRDMLQAVRNQDGFDTAFRRFEIFVNAGQHPGALEVAIGRACLAGDGRRDVTEPETSCGQDTPNPRDDDTDGAPTTDGDGTFDVDDATFMTVLNAVGAISGRAGSLMRRCTLDPGPDGLRVVVPPDQRQRLKSSGLADAILAVAQSGAVPGLTETVSAG